MWIIDMSNTYNMGFSNFPWEPIDEFHGIIINRKIFFPEDQPDNDFNSFKTITHHVGHYFGLPHVYNRQVENLEDINNINEDRKYDSYRPKISFEVYDPSDKANNNDLHLDVKYNPLFMNFMDLTFDKYVAMFTSNQIRKMRFMILKYRPYLDSQSNHYPLPYPKYHPETNTYSDIVGTNRMYIPPVSSYDYADHARELAHHRQVPNLFVNKINQNEIPSTKEQIIENIQYHVPRRYDREIYEDNLEPIEINKDAIRNLEQIRKKDSPREIKEELYAREYIPARFKRDIEMNKDLEERLSHLGEELQKIKFKLQK